MIITLIAYYSSINQLLNSLHFILMNEKYLNILEFMNSNKKLIYLACIYSKCSSVIYLNVVISLGCLKATNPLNY